MKRIIVTGATGLIGRKLVSTLIQRGDELIIFSRDIAKAKTIIPNANEYVEWDYTKPELWKSKLENSYAIVHLAGTNLFAKRWNDSFKNEILKSRQMSTENLVDAIKSCSNKPRVFISASGVGYYGNCGDTILDEASSAGNDFLAEVCRVWEGESKRVEDAGIRSVQIRTGLVLSTEDGALKQMIPPFKFFIGGPLGDGKQWASWLHIEDIIRIYVHAIYNTELRGAVNAASPNPVRMKEIANTLGNVLHRPSLFPVPKFVLKIVIGETAEVVTASQRVDVQKLLSSGFKFNFNFIKEALNDLL